MRLYNTPVRGPLQEAAPQDFHVESLGVAKGNSAAADTAGFGQFLTQSAPTILLKNGGRQDIGVNTYLLSSGLTLVSNLSYEGRHRTLSILKASASMTALLTIGSRSGITVRNLTFDGNTLATSLVSLNAGATDIVFERCIFKNGVTRNIVSFSGTARIRFEECTFYDIASGGNESVLANNGFTFVGCTFLWTQTAALRMLRILHSDVQVLDCAFDGTGVADGSTGAAIHIDTSAGLSDVLVRGSRFQHCGGSSGNNAITVTTGTTAALSDFTLAHNTFLGCGLLAGSASASTVVSINDAAASFPYRNLKLDQNTFDGGGTPIFVGERSQDVSIQGNQSINQVINPNLAGDNGNGIECHAQRAVIRGNTLDKPITQGIWVGTNLGASQPLGTLVEGNSIYQTQLGFGGTQTSGITVSGSDVTLAGNTIVLSSGGGDYGVVLQIGTATSGGNIARVRVQGGTIQNCTAGITLQTTDGATVTDLQVQGVDFHGNTADIGALVLSSVLGVLKLQGNLGFVTEANGTSAIPNGATSVTVTHGLSLTPAAKNISMIPTATTTNAPGLIWVDTVGATTFKVNCTNNPGASTLAFAWQVVVP